MPKGRPKKMDAEQIARKLWASLNLSLRVLDLEKANRATQSHDTYNAIEAYKTSIEVVLTDTNKLLDQLSAT